MKIGIIIPTRGDRPEFLKNCLRMIEAQTIYKMKPRPIIDICIVDYKATSPECDITARYRKGYEYFRGKGFDIIFLLEDDDFYHPSYMSCMINYWEENYRPPILGLQHTVYYHIGLKKYYYMHHRTRSSAMNTTIKPDLIFKWCPDHYAYTDIHLWETIKNGVTVKPNAEICLGIKHGIGLCGGGMHTTQLHRYSDKDSFDDIDFKFLKENTDPESFKFYLEMHKKIAVN